MRAGKSMCGLAVISITLVLFFQALSFAQPPKDFLAGSWSVKYADGSEGEMTIEKNIIRLRIPGSGEIKGRVEQSGEYFESILSDRKGIDFIFGYLKGGKVEGKLQENKPCAELNKAFKSGVASMSSTCQAPFSAVRK